MSEEMLVMHSSPTLAGIKTGSLFNCFFNCSNKLQSQIDKFNSKLNPKGVYIKLLRKSDNKALIYVYRPSKLETDISDDRVKKFLVQSGYRSCDTENCIEQLSSRLSTEEHFPHEIGLFLGYPLYDVKAFIENEGKNCKCVGCWKVYNDEQSAVKTFEKYKKCTIIYCKKYFEGLSIQRLTVGA